MNDSQTDEFLALKAIYEDAFEYGLTDGGAVGHLVVPVILPHPELAVALTGMPPAATIKHLPPITLRFKTTPEYPDQAPPELRVECLWLQPAACEWIGRLLVDQWHQDAALFAFAETLAAILTSDNPSSSDPIRGQHDTLRCLGLDINTETTPPTLIFPSSSHPSLLASLENYNKNTITRIFNTSTHSCCICLSTSILGTQTTQLTACSHTACTSCLSTFWTLHITQGSTTSVKCPEGCLVLLEDLTRVLSKELIDRYLHLAETRKKTLDPNATFCPRIGCGVPVVKKEEDEKLVVCDACGFAFCYFCRRGWHGNLNYCRIENKLDIVQRYETGTPAERMRLVKQYGEKNMTRFVEEVTAERESLEWISKNAQACPQCSSPVEKSEGCNHMKCNICQCHFCYRCGSYLTGNVYDHFNDPQSKCFRRLFEFQEDQEDNLDEIADGDDNHQDVWIGPGAVGGWEIDEDDE